MVLAGPGEFVVLNFDPVLHGGDGYGAFGAAGEAGEVVEVLLAVAMVIWVMFVGGALGAGRRATPGRAAGTEATPPGAPP